MLQTKHVVWLLGAVSLLLAACSSSPVAPPSTQAEAETVSVVDAGVEADVAATVEAAIALAVEATVAARDAGGTPAENSTGDDEADSDNSDAAIADGESNSDPDSEPDSEDGAANGNSAEDGVAAATIESHSDTPMLITPTPDQSAGIAQVVLENTRHFLGDPNAQVTLVEFGDFW